MTGPIGSRQLTLKAHPTITDGRTVLITSPGWPLSIRLHPSGASQIKLQLHGWASMLGDGSFSR